MVNSGTLKINLSENSAVSLERLNTINFMFKFLLLIGASSALLVCIVPDKAIASRRSVSREAVRSISRHLRCSTPQECEEEKIPRTVLHGVGAIGGVAGLIAYLDQRRRKRRIKEIDAELEGLERRL
jgi:hypothetical protein